VTSRSRSSRPLLVALDLRLAGYRTGGITRYAVELSRALHEIPGIDVRPLRSRRDDAGRPPGLRLRTPPHHRFERVSIAVELALARYRPDVYHATDFIAPILPGVPVVATVHDLAFLDWPGDLAPDALAYYGRLERSRRRSAAWITPSHWTAGRLARQYAIDPDTIHVIPHGVSLDLLNEPPLARHERGDYVLAVGTIEPRKRFDLLLEACSATPDLPRLVVAGAPGWRSAAVEERLRAAARVDWIAGATDETLRRLYREAIAVVIPSRAEGFGLPALEAMAVGTPVVSSGGGALPEVTGDAALSPDGDDGEAWAGVIVRIANDVALWERLSRAGRARARDFTWRRTAEQTAAVYRRIAG
jgi:glycosyltransferase involved in cell wall biosynthesis